MEVNSAFGAVMTRHWSQLYPIDCLLVLTQLMQSYASHLLPSLLRCCSCLLFLCRSLLVLQLFCCVSLSTVFGLLQPLLYSTYFSVHAGITCLSCACWLGIICLAFPNLWLVPNVCWDSVSGFPCLWLGNYMLGWLVCIIACWDSKSSPPYLWLGDCMLG